MPPNEPTAAHSGQEPAARDDKDDAEVVLSPEQHATWWAAWVRSGPQGPIADEPDDELPDES
jgi:hypothetical protein